MKPQATIKNRIAINYGEIRFRDNAVWIGPGMFSRLIGAFFLLLIFSLIVIFIFMGMKGDQWLTLLKSTWLIAGFMIYMALNTLGAWGDTMLIDGKRKKVFVTKRWLFYPIKTTIHPFSGVESVVWRDVHPPKKIGVTYRVADIRLVMKKGKWLSIAGISYPQPEKAVSTAIEIANRVAKLIGVHAREEKTSLE